MKKMYFEPESEIVELEMNVALLAGSTPGTDVTEEDYEDVGVSGDPGAVGE